MADRIEKWRPIPSLPEYLASSHGRLMHIPVRVQMPKGGYRIYGGMPITGAWDGTRYILVFKDHTYKVARLICEAFHGAPPVGRPYCLHADENSRNNRPDNLSWGTQKENLNAPGFLAYCHSRTGEKSPAIIARRRRAA